MTQRIKDWGAALLIALAVTLIVGQFDNGPDLPEQAPPFAVAGLDGKALRLADLQGRVVVVNFWASWCGPCRKEIPDFSRFAKENPDVAVLGLAVDSGTLEEVRRSARKLGIDYPVGMADAAVVSAYDVSAFPTTVVVDGSGKVRHVQVGPMTYDQLARVTAL